VEEVEKKVKFKKPKINILNSITQTAINATKTAINNATKLVSNDKKITAPFKILICVSYVNEGSKILEILNSLGIDTNVLVKGYGTPSSSIKDILGLDQLERDIIFSLVTSDKANGLVSKLTGSFAQSELNNTFCCVLNPKSADQEMIKYLKNLGVKKDEKK